MDVISFQKIFGLCGQEYHIVEIRRDVTLVHGRKDDGRTECDDRARVLKAEFAKTCFTVVGFARSNVRLTVHPSIFQIPNNIKTL